MQLWASTASPIGFLENEHGSQPHCCIVEKDYSVVSESLLYIKPLDKENWWKNKY